eukprot:811717-Prymnesium_polylepis.1
MGHVGAPCPHSPRVGSRASDFESGLCANTVCCAAALPWPLMPLRRPTSPSPSPPSPHRPQRRPHAPLAPEGGRVRWAPRPPRITKQRRVQHLGADSR